MSGDGCSVDDASIVARIQSGSEAEVRSAFTELHHRYQNQLLRYLASRGLTGEERKDVASDTWLRAYQGINRYQYRGHSIFAWIRGIADNIMRELFRKRYIPDESTEGAAVDSYGPRTERLASLEKMLEEGQIQPASPDPGPAEEAVSRVVAEEIGKAIAPLLASMPEEYRLVLEYSFEHGFSPAEIADLLDWLPKKVHLTKFRAVAWLKEHMPPEIAAMALDDWLR